MKTKDKWKEELGLCNGKHEYVCNCRHIIVFMNKLLLETYRQGYEDAILKYPKIS